MAFTGFKTSRHHDSLPYAVGFALKLSTVVLVATCAVVIGLELGGVDFRDLARDPVGIAQSGDALHWYSGWASYAGILLWAGASAIGFFVAHMLRRQRHTAANFAVASLLSLLLSVDDLFMVHESLPRIGIPESAFMAMLMLVTAGWVLWFRTELRNNVQLPLLLICGSFFAVSITIDVFELTLVPNSEGITKLVAVVLWAVFHFRTASQAMHHAPLSSAPLHTWTSKAPEDARSQI